MIAQLGRLHPDTLSVIARTSVMRYKKTEAPIDQIGRELGVEYVLEGSAQREGSRVRITAELIRVRGQTQLWADSFEREMSGILALQSDVARNVASALALKLLPAEKTSLANVRSVNAEAYELYLRGLQQRDTLTAAGLDAAQRYFELALAKDTDFALAYAGIANVWACRAQMEITPPREAGPKAKAAALKAMALDDTIAAVHASMGGILAWIDWDWVGAERELRRAIEAGPDTMGARAMYSHVLMIVGRPDEAMPQIERAVELDPFNVLTLSFYTMSLYCERRYDEAIAQARKALSMQPDSGGALSELILALHETKQHDEMIAAAKKLYAGWYPDVGQALERGYAGRDYPGAWRRAAEFEAAKHGGDPGAAYDIAQGALYAGDTARALDWLERACDDRDPNLPYITCEPLWDPVRSDPRFQALLRRMNLPVK
jgi:tetratricopeptide (TPR) repeat protein